MFGKRQKLKKSLEANGLIHDAVIMSLADKYINEDNLRNDEFGLQLLARALNWAVPNCVYDFDKDMESVVDEEIKSRLKHNENQVFEKGLAILNSDPLVEQLISHYVAYEIYLIEALFPQEEQSQSAGVRRMKKFLFQSTERAPNILAAEFRENYKNLFERFNGEYGKYGKVLKQETIDSLFSFI